MTATFLCNLTLLFFTERMKEMMQFNIFCPPRLGWGKHVRKSLSKISIPLFYESVPQTYDFISAIFSKYPQVILLEFSFKYKLYVSMHTKTKAANSTFAYNQENLLKSKNLIRLKFIYY